MPLQYGHLHVILTTSDRLNVLLAPFVKETGEGSEKVQLVDFEALAKDQKASLLLNRLLGNMMNIAEEIKKTDIGTMVDFDLGMDDDDPEVATSTEPPTEASPDGAPTAEELAEAVASSATAEEIDNLLEDLP